MGRWFSLQFSVAEFCYSIIPHSPIFEKLFTSQGADFAVSGTQPVRNVVATDHAE